MRLIFIYGPVASGKLTVARALAARTGLPLFHNHLVVDAVSSVFPFGSEEFVRLREQFWLEIIKTAASMAKSLIFTFAPEPSVAPGFAQRVVEIVEAHDGRVVFVALTLTTEQQEERLVRADRTAFGKLRSVATLRQLRTECAACLDGMPGAAVTIDTGETSPSDAVGSIMKAMYA